MGEAAPRLPEAEILTQLESYSRQPFLDTLARILGCEPKAQQLQAFANKYPDRWAQTAAIFGRLGGYSDKTEIVNVSVLAIVKNASDSELLSRISEIESRLRMQGDPADKATLINPPSDKP